MDDGEVIAQIRWKVADVRDAFARKYGRQPTDGELSRCVRNVQVNALENTSIERGWDFIEEAII